MSESFLNVLLFHVDKVFALVETESDNVSDSVSISC
jgi:hypothetical protein